MRNKLQPYFDLVRLPNLFTAAADVLAGFFFAGGLPEEWPIALRLCLSSMCLYAGGVAFNDVCDTPHDAIERPERPIPSGKISRAAAFRLSVGLLLIGVGVAATVSIRSAAFATAIVVTILFYDALFKHTPFAPVFMGLCRALNLSLGLFALPSLAIPRAARPIALMWLYIASVTFFARKEVRGGGRFRLALGTLGACLAVLGLWSLRWSGYDARFGEFRYLVVVLLVLVAYNGFRTWADPTPVKIQAGVKHYILSLIVFDACLAWVSGGPMAAAVVASLLIPTMVCARYSRVT
ncbi:MAG: UbiA family prenyltransferase [Phycisphaerales bacterium]|nr:UbiA family prenyltransferase [Phycisphaerales bacterium]